MMGPLSLAASVIARCSGSTRMPTPPRRKARPGFELLEGRIVLSQSYTWTGKGDGKTWNSPANWDNAQGQTSTVAPPAGSAVTFPADSPGTYTTVEIEQADVSGVTIQGNESRYRFEADPKTSGASLTFDNNADIDTAPGAVLSLASGLTVTRDGNLQMTGAGTVVMSGQLSLNEAAAPSYLPQTGQYDGDLLTLDGTTLDVPSGYRTYAGSLNGDGTVSMGYGATLYLNTPAGESDVFGGTIIGSGTLAKGGGGSLTVGGFDGSSYDGVYLKVNYGTVLVDGQSTLSNLYVGYGATFGGPGDVTVSGSASFASTSTFAVEIDGGPTSNQFTQLNADSVNIRGGTLAIGVGPGYKAASGDGFPVISSGYAYGVGGSFDSVSTTIAGGASTTDNIPYDVNYGTSSVGLQPQFQPTTTTASLVGSATATYGQKVTLDARVAETSGGGQTPTGSVTFYDGDPSSGGKSIGTATLSGGAASIQTTALAVAGSPHAIYAVYAPASNTDFAGSTSSQPVSVSITPASLKVSGITAKDKTYDGTTTATLDTSHASFTGLVNGDTVGLAATGYTASFADKNVGTNKPVTVSGLTLTGAAAGDYTLVQPTGLEASITPASLQVTGLQVANKVYDGTTSDSLVTSNAKLVGVISGDSVQLVTTGAQASFADKNVGTNKPVTVSGLALSGAQASDYTLQLPSLSADITPATLRVTADPETMTYGGAVPALGYTAQGLVPGDTEGSACTGSLATTGSSRTDVGNYPITQGTLASENYTIQFAGATLSIVPAVLTIEANDESMTTGSPLPTLTVHYAGFVDGDGPASLTTPPSVSTTATASSPAGTYPITVGGATSPDYAIQFVGGTLTIAPPPSQPQQAPTGGSVQSVSMSPVALGKRRKGLGIVLQLAGTIDSSATQDMGNYSLTTMPKGRKKGKPVPLRAAVFDSSAMTLTLVPGRKMSAVAPMQLTIDAAGLGLSGGNIVAIISKSGAAIV